MKRQVFLIVLTTLLLTAACRRDDEKVITPSVSPDRAALQVRTFEALWSTINDNYVYDDFNGVDWAALKTDYQARVASADQEEFEAILAEIVTMLPEGAVILQTRQERIEAAIADTDTSSYEGIGAYVAVRGEPEPRVVILEVMPGSPADAAGLKAHDSILLIDEEPVTAVEGLNAVDRIRGPANTDVVLRIHSANQPPRDVTITRARVERVVNRLQVQRLEETNIAYISFPPATYDTMIEDLVNGIQLLFNNAAGVDSFILDLRVARASDNWPIGALLTLFGTGNMGQFYSRQGISPVPIEGQNLFGSQVLPLAILTGTDTSGLAEIFAAAMQAAGRGVIVGTATPGLVEQNQSFFLPNGSQLLINIATYRAANGRDIGLLGVAPDLAVDVDWDGFTTEQDPVRDAALELLQNNG